MSVDIGCWRHFDGRGGAGMEDAQRVLLALVAQRKQKRFLYVHELVDVVELLCAGERPLCTSRALRLLSIAENTSESVRYRDALASRRSSSRGVTPVGRRTRVCTVLHFSLTGSDIFELFINIISKDFLVLFLFNSAMQGFWGFGAPFLFFPFKREEKDIS